MPEPVAHTSLEALRTGDALVLRITGELDLHAALHHGPRIDRALVARPSRTVADLRGLTFLDCSGLSLLIRVRRQVARWGGEFTVYCPNRNALRILRYVDVGPPLDFVEQLPEPSLS
ncbi:STAS domain-containing protein [Streptomyces sp. CA-294286]|uniref:STAS domain-containing protein n=1 Tax=Streptomyces sp. CA-294286 TaxID=3240070 RepID=UPI003D8FC800